MTSKQPTIRKLEVFDLPLRAPLTDGGRIITVAGELTQVWNGSPIRFLAYVEFQVNNRAPRGNHYHNNHEEHLYIIRGRIELTYQDIENGEVGGAILESGDLVTFPPQCAHVFVPLEYSQAIEFSASQYDPADTIKRVVPSE